MKFAFCYCNSAHNWIYGALLSLPQYHHKLLMRYCILLFSLTLNHSYPQVSVWNILLAIIQNMYINIFILIQFSHHISEHNPSPFTVFGFWQLLYYISCYSVPFFSSLLNAPLPICLQILGFGSFCIPFCI